MNRSRAIYERYHNKPINIKPKLRPCLIFNTNSNGERYSKKALFHRWVDYTPINIYDNDRVRAMVELMDGTIEMVPPSLIKFTDRGGDRRETIRKN